MWEWRCSATILDFGTRWRWVISFTSRPLYPWRNPPGTYWIGGCMGLRAVLDFVRKRKLSPAEIRNPVVQPISRRNTNSAGPIGTLERKPAHFNHEIRGVYTSETSSALPTRYNEPRAGSTCTMNQHWSLKSVILRPLYTKPWKWR
jgi:hypothetical protein